MDNFHNFFNFLEFFSSLGKAHNKIMHSCHLHTIRGSSSQGDLRLNLGAFSFAGEGGDKNKSYPEWLFDYFTQPFDPSQSRKSYFAVSVGSHVQNGKSTFQGRIFFTVSRNIAKSKRNDSVSLHFVLKQKKYSKRKWDTLVPLSRLH